MFVEMGGVSSTITQATRASTDELFTHNTLYVYVYVRHPVCCRLLVYSAHKIEAEDEGKEAIL